MPGQNVRIVIHVFPRINSSHFYFLWPVTTSFICIPRDCLHMYQSISCPVAVIKRYTLYQQILRYILTGREKTLSRLDSVHPLPNKPLFLRVYCTSVLKTLWGKKKLLVTSNFFFSQYEQFLLFAQHFLRFWRTLCQFRQILNRRLQTLWVWKSPNFFLPRKRLNTSEIDKLDKHN